MPTSTKHDINTQTRDHDEDTVHGQGQRGVTQQPASPIAIVIALATSAPLDTRRELGRVVLVLDEALVVRGVRVGDLVVEEARQDEGDGGGACAADVGEDEGERGDGHGGDEGEDDENGGHNGEAHIAHFLARLGCGVADERVPCWAALLRGGASAGPPLCAGVEAGAAGVDLQRVGEHD